MSSPEEQDAVDPQAYIQSTFNIGSLLLSYGFKAERGLTFGWWSRTVGDRYYRVVFDDDDITSTGEIWHVNEKGEHHRVLVTNHFSKVNQLDNWLKTYFKRTESIEDDADVDPKSYAIDTISPDAILSKLGFVNRGQSFTGFTKKDWLDCWVKQTDPKIVFSVLVDPKTNLVRYRKVRLRQKNKLDGDFTVLHSRFDVPVSEVHLLMQEHAESSELVHRLLDAIPDALEPLGEIDQLVEPRCPACESTDVTEKDAENLCDCMSCGIWFKPDALNEDGEDDPTHYIDDLPDRATTLFRRVADSSCTQEEAVEYAIIQAESVLHIFEKDFPDDKRPRQAIEAARRWWNDPSEANRLAAANAAAKTEAAIRGAQNTAKAYPKLFGRASAPAGKAALCAAMATLATVNACTFAGNANYFAAVAKRRASTENRTKRVRESLEDEISDLKAYALLHGNGPQNPRIVTTFNTITPESAEQCDYADSGWEDETGFDCTPDEFDEEEGKTVADVAAKFLWNKGASDSSSSHFSPGGWYSSERSTTDWRTGEETEYDFHLVCFTPEQEQEVWNKLQELRRPRPRN